MNEAPGLMDCRICSQVANEFAEAVILGRHTIRYFRCASCGFIQTEEPYWLDEAYSDAIIATDIGLVCRNMQLARQTRTLITGLFDADGRFVDYGGGYGLFVRMMRDAGFDFYRCDPYCENLFAKAHDFPLTAAEPMQLVTAFEVFEHLVDPIAEVEKMLAFSRNILFTTLLVPESVPRPGEWWYYALEGGQHVSLYTVAALRHLAERFGLQLLTDGSQLHLLTEKNISSRWFRLLLKRSVARWWDRWHRRQSLLEADYQSLTGHQLV